MKIAHLIPAMAGILLLLPAAAAPTGIPGTWANPRGTVHVRYQSCGQGAICGTVVWASAKAIADAKRGGTANLVGTRIFRDLHRDGPNRWKGRVFAPDLDQSLSGTVTVRGRQMVGEGCLIGKLGCKSQVWTRVR